ncbi:ABC transporter substrate-binding protein [Natronococcus jeotgali]|uniref:Fe3+-hydroxamate ABC transporter periplasmic component-like protein n=1 Tax=Natronococcus jeotgali DSM 18795 TaxID=1227498 RepID=L9WRD3_9EURY|nr:ABC transporter substrate-binding protein [Natronococcus jeotgali]ELY51781.1 Fe3+-hydroxamate ABC transporter periplasmic component-like protein [Natronococcus jeotgali DSM 18795]
MDETRSFERTRRELLAAGVAVGTGATAGCVSETEGGDENGTAAADSHTATLAPAGEVEFDAVPEDALVTFPQYTDMMVALGHGEAANSLFSPEMAGPTMNAFYDRLEGVSFEWEELPNPLEQGLVKEQVYELDSDVHFLDPSYVLTTEDGWSEADLEEIADAVGPWFGNFHSGVHSEPADAYADGYEYYSLWELFERVAAVFREGERYDALAAVHDDLQSTIESNLPPEDERPTAARVTLGDGEFYAYHLNADGFWQADTRPLGARDALADREWSGDWGVIDYEAMAEADPDVVLHLWGITPQYDIASVRERLEDHPVGATLAAVENDRVVAGGMRYQGPLMNLFQLEMTAKQLYPERFGEWPGHSSGESYPEIPAEERLFDRERVAEIVAGSS